MLEIKGFRDWKPESQGTERFWGQVVKKKKRTVKFPGGTTVEKEN